MKLFSSSISISVCTPIFSHMEATILTISRSSGVEVDFTLKVRSKPSLKPASFSSRRAASGS